MPRRSKRLQEKKEQQIQKQASHTEFDVININDLLDIIFSFLVIQTISVPFDFMDSFSMNKYCSQSTDHLFYLALVSKRWRDLFYKQVENIKIMNFEPDEEITQIQMGILSVQYFNLQNLRMEFALECKQIFNFDDMVFPKLKQLKLNLVCFESGINFKSYAFPMLECLDLININTGYRNCTFDFDLPNLRKLSIEHTICDNVAGFISSIQKSTKLEYFSTYKFNIFDELIALALPNVQTIKIMRMDCITDLKLWAPKLEKLLLSSNWELKKVEMLTKIPKSFRKIFKQYDTKKYSDCIVEIMCCDTEIIDILGRCKENDTVEDDYSSDCTY